MDQKSAAFDSLQALLNGQSIAIHTYDAFIPEVKDPELKAVFQKIRSGHRKQLDQVTRRIEELGYRPRIKLNPGMKLGELIIDARTRIGIAEEKMVRWALKGEDMGLTTTEEIVKGDLDEVSKELVDFILDDSNHYINELINFIHE